MTDKQKATLKKIRALQQYDHEDSACDCRSCQSIDLIDALLKPCETCGGSKRVRTKYYEGKRTPIKYYPCPDCTDNPSQEPADTGEFVRKLRDEAEQLQLYAAVDDDRGAFKFADIYKACDRLEAAYCSHKALGGLYEQLKANNSKYATLLGKNLGLHTKLASETKRADDVTTRLNLSYSVRDTDEETIKQLKATNKAIALELEEAKKVAEMRDTPEM